LRANLADKLSGFDAVPLLEKLASAVVADCAVQSGHLQPDTRSSAIPTDPFTDFIHHQRALLIALWGKGKVSIKSVLQVLYRTNSNDKLEALLQVVKRTNRKLATMELQQRYEVGRRGEFLELRQV
jgi:hypothetical protein